MLIGAKYVLHCAVHMLWYWEMTVSIVVLLRHWPDRLRWCRGSVLASDTQVRGFEPG